MSDTKVTIEKYAIYPSLEKYLEESIKKPYSIDMCVIHKKNRGKGLLGFLSEANEIVGHVGKNWVVVKNLEILEVIKPLCDKYSRVTGKNILIEFKENVDID
jgi:hypothetical protein